MGGLGAVVLSLLAVLLGWAIYAGDEDDPGLGDDATPTVAQVVADPDRYAGGEVIVGGPVQRLIGSRAALIGDERLLVLARRLPRDLGPGDVVQVVGSVRRFDAGAAEAELGLRLDASLARRLAGRPGVVATRVTVEPAPVAAARPVTPARLETDRSLDGTLVVVRGRVSHRLAPAVLVIEDRLVVLAPVRAARRARVGSVVAVAGRASRFRPSVAGRELGVELTDDRYRPWRGRPAVSASSLLLLR